MRRVLAVMVQAEAEDRLDDAEVACEGIVCWLGEARVSRSTVNALLRLTALRDVSLSDGGHGILRLSLNDVGRAIHARPSIVDEITEALCRGRGFTIRDNRVVRI